MREYRTFEREQMLTAVRDVEIPKARPASDTHAYSLEDVVRMLALLPERASMIVAVAAFTGARKGEIRGFVWEG